MSIFDKILDLIYTPRCAGCGEAMYPYKQALCPICHSNWEIEKKKHCPQCGKEHIKCRCDIPANSGGVISDIVHLCGYSAKTDSVPKHVVLSLKQSHDSRLFEFVAGELSTPIVKLNNFDRGNCLITYVPRSPEKLKETGVDQSEKLAKAVSEKLGVPFACTLKHINTTHLQKELDSAGRIENSLRAFRPLSHTESSVTGKDIILIDDVITTGASVFACACLLTGCGAASVSAASVCRTI